jgi:hypothetical protein
MNYVWEAALKAIELGISPDDLVFRPARSPNPCLEVNLPDINSESFEGDTIEINALYRFSSIFGDLIDTGWADWQEARLALFNALFHAISDMEARQGVSRREFYLRFLEADIETAVFGPALSEGMACFERKERRLILGALLKQYRMGFSLQILRELFRRLYPSSNLYLFIDGGKRLLIYLGRERTTERERRLAVIQDLFIPMDYQVTLFWEKHFGIIGVDETMIPGEIMMF